MALKIIVSYDDTDNDRDALALGRLLATAGAELSLAYVRHSYGESLEQKEAEELLAHGAAAVGAPDMARHIVINPNTSVGLSELAEAEGADVIVFGSEYRTAAGTGQAGDLGPQTAARRPVDDRRRAGGAARAPRGRRQHRRRDRRGRRGGAGDRGQPRGGARRERRQATRGPVDLLVVGSRPESPQGRVTLSASSDYAVEAATFPVIVVPRGGRAHSRRGFRAARDQG